MWKQRQFLMYNLFDGILQVKMDGFAIVLIREEKYCDAKQNK